MSGQEAATRVTQPWGPLCPGHPMHPRPPGEGRPHTAGRAQTAPQTVFPTVRREHPGARLGQTACGFPDHGFFPRKASARQP